MWFRLKTYILISISRGFLSSKLISREIRKKLCFLIKNAKKLIIEKLMNEIIGECRQSWCVMGGKVVSKAARMGNSARLKPIKCAAGIVSAARTNRCLQSRNLSPLTGFEISRLKPSSKCR